MSTVPAPTQPRLAIRVPVAALWAVAAALVVAHILVVYAWFGDAIDEKATGLKYWHISIFDLDEEESFGTWFSAMILLLAGQLLLQHARLARAAPGRWVAWWTVLAVGFHVLSVDEVVGMHEYLNTLLGETSWTDVGIVGVAVVALAFLPFLVSLPARTRIWFVIAGLAYVGGAVGVERATEVYDTKEALNSLAYNLWNALEEGLEMAGVLLFITELVRMLASPARAADGEAPAVGNAEAE